jgi:hypothetical protein
MSDENDKIMQQSKPLMFEAAGTARRSKVRTIASPVFINNPIIRVTALAEDMFSRYAAGEKLRYSL